MESINDNDNYEIDTYTLSSNNNRKYYLDILRIMACFFVIINHTNSQIFLNCSPSINWVISLIYFFISKMGVPIFLLISGVTLLGKVDTYKKCIKRMLYIALIILIFSFLYYLDQVFTGRIAFNLYDFIKIIYHDRITNAFWYLYMYLGLLVMMPILQRLVRACTKKDLQYILIWSIVILGSFPILLIYCPTLKYYDRFDLPLFNIYIGLMVAGYYFNKYVLINKKNTKIALTLLSFFLTTSVCLTYIEFIRRPDEYLSYDNHGIILTTGGAICLFILVKNIMQSVKLTPFTLKILSYIGKLTFGIYLLSDLIIEKVQPVYEIINAYAPSLIAMLIYEIIVFSIGGVITAMFLYLCDKFKKKWFSSN